VAEGVAVSRARRSNGHWADVIIPRAAAIVDSPTYEKVLRREKRERKQL
jgi:uncharacterized protein (DUF1810 family)